jgi:hypothetical protein
VSWRSKATETTLCLAVYFCPHLEHSSVAFIQVEELTRASTVNPPFSPFEVHFWLRSSFLFSSATMALLLMLVALHDCKDSPSHPLVAPASLLRLCHLVSLSFPPLVCSVPYLGVVTSWAAHSPSTRIPTTSIAVSGHASALPQRSHNRTELEEEPHLGMTSD